VSAFVERKKRKELRFRLCGIGRALAVAFSTARKEASSSRLLSRFSSGEDIDEYLIVTIVGKLAYLTASRFTTRDIRFTGSLPIPDHVTKLRGRCRCSFEILHPN
jgi:hypothetical protein